MAQQGDPTTPISKKIFPLFLLDPLLTHKKKEKKKKKKKRVNILLTSKDCRPSARKYTREKRVEWE
jgi:hypothetical protein